MNHDRREGFTVREIAEMLPLSRWSIYRLIKSKQIAAVLIGGTIVVSKEEVNRLLERSRFTGVEELLRAASDALSR